MLIGALFGTEGWAPNVSGQTNAGTPLPSNRWLLVVDTSGSMQSRAEAVQQIAAMPLWHGMNGQLRRGDTVGLWTYNENLLTGSFPLKQWTPGTSQSVARQVYEFLKKQKYEKDSRLDKVFPDIERVIKDSDFITVILISDGRENIRGTPFDGNINAIYQTWKEEQERVRFPIITVLRAQHGQITSYAVTIPPWPLELPPLPAELQPATPPEAKAPQPPPPAPPLILRGKMPEPPPAPQPIASNTPPPAPAVPDETLEKASVPSPAPPASENPVQRPTVSDGKPNAANRELSQPAETGNTETVSPVPPLPPAVTTTGETNAPADVATASPSRTNATLQAGPPARPAARAAPVQTAVTVPSKSVSSRGHFWIIALGIIGLALSGIALGIVFLLARRLRTPIRLNLANRPLDREHKQ